jgi:hypothetical protein
MSPLLGAGQPPEQHKGFCSQERSPYAWRKMAILARNLTSFPSQWKYKVRKSCICGVGPGRNSDYRCTGPVETVEIALGK